MAAQKWFEIILMPLVSNEFDNIVYKDINDKLKLPWFGGNVGFSSLDGICDKPV